MKNLFLCSNMCCLCEATTNSGECAKGFCWWWTVVIPHIIGGAFAILILVVSLRTIVFVSRVNIMKILKKLCPFVKAKNYQNKIECDL